MLYTAVVHFHYLLIVLKFFLFLVWICGIMLGRNTNLSSVQQNVSVSQLPQATCFVFFPVCEWHLLVLTQKNSPVGSTSLAKPQQKSWEHFCHGMAKWCLHMPALLSSCSPKSLREHSCPSVVWYPLHSPACSPDPPERKVWKDCWRGLAWKHMALSILGWKPLVDVRHNSWGSNAFCDQKGFHTERVS